jgi:hypothetical protein
VRVFVAGLVLTVSMSCASSGSVGATASLSAGKTQLWLAAQRAIRDMGGRIVHADEATGTVAGRLDVEGTPVDLNVTISGSPAPGSPLEGPWDVTTRASLAGDPAPDEEWQRRLRFLADELLQRISAASPGRGSGLQP